MRFGVPRLDLSIAEWARCTWTDLSAWFERRRASSAELVARRASLIRVYARFDTGPTRMGVGPQLMRIERELRRRGIPVDADEWMHYSRRGR